MATNILTFARPLSAIIADIAVTRERHARLDQEIGTGDATDEQDRTWALLDQRIDALTQEARAAVYEATGVSWDLLERALA